VRVCGKEEAEAKMAGDDVDAEMAGVVV